MIDCDFANSCYIRMIDCEVADTCYTGMTHPDFACNRQTHPREDDILDVAHPVGLMNARLHFSTRDWHHLHVLVQLLNLVTLKGAQQGMRALSKSNQWRLMPAGGPCLAAHAAWLCTA